MLMSLACFGANSNLRGMKLNDNQESLQLQSKKPPVVLCNNYNSDWTTFSLHLAFKHIMSAWITVTMQTGC